MIVLIVIQQPYLIRVLAFRINFKNNDIQDGNGFKVGGWGKSADAKKLYGAFSGENHPVHIVKNCSYELKKIE